MSGQKIKLEFAGLFCSEEIWRVTYEDGTVEILRDGRISALDPALVSSLTNLEGTDIASQLLAEVEAQSNG